MPRVRIEWLSIRSDDQRQALARRITEAVAEEGLVAPATVTVVFEEQDPHYVFKGGKRWSDVLGGEGTLE